ncbi:MAG: aspartate--tRNA ligase [Deltaproteobacteria bacterium]|nr:aspartate--tRNA ligase [Deltaproteobacteria bacterium]
MTYNGRSNCGYLTLADVGREVQVAGWVDALRDHGEVIFIHLRDRSGIVQVVFSPEFAPPRICECAASLRNEFCVAATGRVMERAKTTINPSLETGQIEIIAEDLIILSQSETLPFPISEKAMVGGAGAREAGSVAEDLRLQYRYLDLRRPSMQNYLSKRHRIYKRVRDFLDQQSFIEIETPMLTKSTPEGARDYLVPSRIHQRRFYALPQSPQLFKQLLMISGFERYYQIVRCFRDEDLRPNRQPEFTQLDIESSFIDEEFIYELVEELTVRMFEVGGISLSRPFPRMTYQEAMDTTGSDRPDLRFGLRIVEATDIFRDTTYGIFKQVLLRGGCIRGIAIKGHSENLSKNVLQNEYAKEIVPGFGAKGMTWMRVLDTRLESNIVQFFHKDEQRAIIERFGAENGDVIMMIADASRAVVISALGQLRLHVAGRLGLIPVNEYRPVWITDFPLFQTTEEGITSSHHPFTAPDRIDFDPTDREALFKLRSRAYDLVVNGEELGGGSIRINDRNLQHKIFKALGLSDSEVEEKFGFFLRALDYGAPPHGGIALGMDRIVSMILNTSSIREVIAFPKNRSAFCPLTQAPSPVAHKQLAELGLLNLGGEKQLAGTEEHRDLTDVLSFVSRIALNDKERPAVAAALKEAARLAGLVKERAGKEDPIFSVLRLANRTRQNATGKPSPLAEKGELFKNAPAMKGHFFKVASILE